MSGILGGVGSKSGVIGRDRGVLLWTGTNTGGSTTTITMNQSMEPFNWITIIYGDGSYDSHTMPMNFFKDNVAGGTHGHMLNAYDNEHVYAKWIDNLTIKVFDGSAGCAIYRVIGTV